MASVSFFEAVEPMSQVIAQFNRHDEDSVDRLNHKYSTLQFIALAVIVTANQYVGETIKCWAPAQFPDAWIEYTNQVCWISNTYYIPIMHTDITNDEVPRQEIVYYQWVSLILFLQALLFFLPSVFWYAFNRSIGVNINKIVSAIRHADEINPGSRDKATKALIIHIDRTLKYTKDIHLDACTAIKRTLAHWGCFCGKRYGNFLIVTYMITKILYLVDVMLQLYMLNFLLGTDYVFYGVEVVRDLINTGTYKENLRFPRVTLCDFKIRTFGQTQDHTVQCTLPINLFNEKIFIYVWFWLVFMALINTCSLISWLWIAFATNRRNFVKKYLKIHGEYDREYDRSRLHEFCTYYLRQDGHFVLRMIAKNTNDVVVGELIRCLWVYHEKDLEKQQKKQEV